MILISTTAPLPTTMHRLSDYDYDLPQELIATDPPPEREDARLMLVERQSGRISHHTIRDLPRLLNPHDCLVLNNTRVLPARLFGHRAATGGKWEGLYVGTDENGHWRILGQTRGRLQPGESVIIEPAHDERSAECLTLTLHERDGEGIWTATADTSADPVEVLTRFGTVPLPPYIHRRKAAPADWDRYQTTYSQAPGAVAAPTAGLHFTPELLAECRGNGIDHVFVTLHVGIGTFRPIAVEQLSDHVMHEEWCELPQETAERLKTARNRGGRVVAVGTTSVRTLEAAALHADDRSGWSGTTDLFIRPPWEFRRIDCLLTNFHLPRSSLLVMVSALAGYDLIREAYATAVRERYRFFSYGDAMLIV